MNAVTYSDFTVTFQLHPSCKTLLKDKIAELSAYALLSSKITKQEDIFNGNLNVVFTIHHKYHKSTFSTYFFSTCIRIVFPVIFFTKEEIQKICDIADKELIFYKLEDLIPFLTINRLLEP